MSCFRGGGGWVVGLIEIKATQPSWGLGLAELGNKLFRRKMCQMSEIINCCFYEAHHKRLDSQCNGNKFGIFNIFHPDFYVALCFMFCTIWSVEIVLTNKHTKLTDTRFTTFERFSARVRFFTSGKTFVISHL